MPSTAIYREILSSSRASQGQPPVGILSSSAAQVVPPGRWCFGACDEFQIFRTWIEIAAGLETGALAAAMLTGKELARTLLKTGMRQQFLSGLTVVADLPPALEKNVPLAERIFIVTPRAKGAAGEANHVLILIECKSAANALNSMLNSMPDRPHSTDQLVLDSTSALGLLHFSQPLDGLRLAGEVVTTCKSNGIEVSILGIYPATETYGG